MLDHFDLIASVYDRLIGPPDTGRLQQLLQLPTTGWPWQKNYC
jgi:demethylmenaquinone methyltransferase/2-methoxy-6-polyprenyl-1,4-benzoquinol methylase